MSDRDLHLEDHRRILNALDCSQAVAALDKDVSLLHLMIKEMKDEKEKANRTLMWVCGMAFTIIMAVSGTMINSNATISVLQEKVTEQKSEIENLHTYIGDVVDQLNDVVSNHKH